MGANLTTVDEAEAYLLAYSPEQQGGGTYTLERMQVLMERLGNPQNDMPAVHIAGTSGKTSTTYYVRALLEAHGKKTGLTASPHITSITERVQVSGVPLPDAQFLIYLNEFIDIIEPWSDIQPTYFELLVAFAFWVFKRENVEYMVIEVGLGGLLDATNVIDSTNKVCVITPIGLDHTQILGNTVKAIAAQKAGIIQNGTIVLSASQEADAKDVLIETVNEKDVWIDFVDAPVDSSLDVPMFQQQNFALARAAVELIKIRDGLNDVTQEEIDGCIASTPPGRFEIYTIGDKTVILDGAHNPQKLHAFVESLNARFGGPFVWLFGMMESPDQKVHECLEAIAGPNDTYVFTQFEVNQDIKRRMAVGADELSRRMNELGVADIIAELDADVALERALGGQKQVIVVTGSLYLVARLRNDIITQSIS